MKSTRKLALIAALCILAIMPAKAMHAGLAIEATENKQRLTEQLFQLIKEKAPYAAIKPILDKGAYVKAKDARGDTPLHLAARKGLIQVCFVLINRGADVNAQNNDGDTPFKYAADKKRTETCLALIAKGMAINEENEDGDTPLLIAARKGLTEVCLSLIMRGADVNAREPYDFGCTPLIYAANKGLTDLCKIILRYILLSKLLALAPTQSLSERRMQMLLAIMTLKKIDNPELPREIIERIYQNKPLSNDWIACCYARYCCYFEESSITRELLCDCLGQENIDNIKQTMQSAYIRCDPAKHPALKSLLNPENFDSNFEAIFLSAYSLD